jgi:iron complex outermembrane recepter protein
MRVSSGPAPQTAVTTKIVLRGSEVEKKKLQRRSKRLVLGLSALALANVCAAASSESDTGKLDEVIVTAQKREQNLQDVGTSVTAFDATALQKLGLKDVTELAGQVPGMQYNQFGATVTVFNLRGVSQNDFSDHQEAPVAVYADDAYVVMLGALAGSMYDLERVEVLRGPQGTLFGRNATGGLIQYISRKPTDTPDGYVQLTAGNFGTLQSEGALGGPISDRVSGRISFSTSDHNGYITNRIGPDIEDQRQAAVRLQLRIKPTDDGEILIKLHGVNNDNETGGIYSWAASQPDATGRGYFVGPNYVGNCPQLNGGCTPGADDTGYRNPSSSVFNQAENRRGIFNRTVWGANVHTNWNFSGVALTSVTDYLRMQKRYGEDTDLSPNSTLNYDTLQHYHQISQELRLSGKSGALNWIAGLYYLDYHTGNFIGVEAIDPFGGVSSGNFTLSSRTASVFAQVEYALTDRWTLIGGGRYTNDDKRVDYTFEPQDLHYNPGTYPQAARKFNLPTGKAEVDYKVNEATLLYGSVNRGAKGGGWSAPNSGVVNPASLPYDQEKLTSYEAGEKTTFLDGAARLNASVFYYDYKNYQGFFIEGLASYVKNLDAKVKGGEVELAFIPTKGMDVQLGLSNLNSQVFNVPTPAGELITAQLPQAPKWSVNAEIRYSLPVTTGTLTFEADAKWNKAQYLELINAEVDYQPSYAITNGRITYAGAGGNWDITVFGKNLTDKIYRQYNLDLSGVGWNLGVYAPPRLYGATFTYYLGK